MRYEKDHKEATHRRVVETASARFRKEGIDAVGVASLMSDAGLTHGGFYSHFPSKEKLVEEALISSMEASMARHAQWSESGGLEAFIRSYLRSEHRDTPEKGCTVAALVAEVARRPKATRAAFTKRLQKMISNIEAHLPHPDPAKARALFSLLIGTVQLARAITDPALSDAVLESGVQGALALVSAGKK